MPKMDTGQLASIVRRELNDALGADGGQLSADRRSALEYYQGEPLGNEVEGRSQVVMRSVLEAVEWVLPALLRIFTASDKIAEFEPQGTDNPDLLRMREAAAEQATDYVSYIFYRDNAGFLILHDWFKSALIQKLGWIKVYWDTQRSTETSTFTGLSEAEYAALKADPDIELAEEKSYPAPTPGGFEEDAPSLEPGTLYDCTIRKTREEGRVKIEAVPPEEVLFSRRATSGKAPPFICHRVQRTYSDLVECGYDRDVLDTIGEFDEPELDSERLARFLPEDDSPDSNRRTDRAMRPIWIEESYIRIDYDGDGIAELRKVVTSAGGQVVLTRGGDPDIELADDVPLISLCPIPMPHKLVGMSVADLVMDLQRIKSTLIRQMLDNAYLSNWPRMEVSEAAVTDDTYDDLLTMRPGGIVRTKTPGGINPLMVPFTGDKTMALVEYFDQTQEVRTGIDRRNQGLSPDDLNKTAAAASMYQQAAAQRVELTARIFAETGIKRLCRRVLGLVTKYQQQERIVRLTGQYVPIDPRQWDDNMDVTVSVGLGTGNRDQVVAHMQQVLAAQLQLVQLQGGVNGPVVYAKDVYDALEYTTENLGLKQSFFTDPTKPPNPEKMGPPQPPRPDPNMMKVQAQIAADQARQQASVAADMRKEQFDMERDRRRADFERQNDERDFLLRQHVAAQDAALKRWEAEQRAALAVREMEARLELERQAVAMRQAAAAAQPAENAA